MSSAVEYEYNDPMRRKKPSSIDVALILSSSFEGCYQNPIKDTPPYELPYISGLPSADFIVL